MALSDDFVCMFPVSRTSIPGILHDDLSMLYCCRQNEMATNSLSSSEVVSDFRIAQEEKRLRERGTVLLYTCSTLRSALILFETCFY